MSEIEFKDVPRALSSPELSEVSQLMEKIQEAIAETSFLVPRSIEINLGEYQDDESNPPSIVRLLWLGTPYDGALFMAHLRPGQ